MTVILPILYLGGVKCMKNEKMMITLLPFVPNSGGSLFKLDSNKEKKMSPSEVVELQ